MTPLTVLSEEERLLYDSVLAFARARVAPRSAEMDRAGALDAELIPELFGLGIMAVEVPETYGGAGSSFFNAILPVEALARVDPSVAVFVDVQNTLVNNAILRWASDEQKERYLTRLASDWVGSYALSEAEAGSDAFALKARAEHRGDKWILNGQKLWTTNGAESSLFIVFANGAPEKGYKGLGAFLVERDFPGFSVGKKEDKLGIRASSTCELVLENCEVPAENVMAELGLGHKVAMETLNEGRIGIGAQMVGLALGALDHAMAHLLERKQFGSALADFQGLQFQYAKLATEIEAARLMVYNAARLKDAQQPFAKEAAMAKYYAAEVAERAASLAVDFMGGVGFTRDCPVEKLYRDAKIGKIYEGTSNMQLLTIAKLVKAAYGARS
jgi:alkylation response protein AidB-like acyl-CoA dehydrogenase